MPPKVTFVVPALDEAGNLETSLYSLAKAADAAQIEREIFVFDDGSTDGTGDLAALIASRDRTVTVARHESPRGIGACFWEGLLLASGDWIMLIPGDAEVPEESILRILKEREAADVIAPYWKDDARPVFRRLLSRAYALAVRTLTGTRLRYYNGTCLFRRETLDGVEFRPADFSFMTAALVGALRSGAKVIEVEVPLGARRAGTSKAISFSSFLAVSRGLLRIARGS